MAHVTLRDGRELDVDDSDVSLLDYYRGEGARIEDVAQAVTFPVVFVGGERVDPPAPPLVADDGEYDPGAYTVEQVNEHLAGVDDVERDRIFDLEAAGKARVGILDGPHSVFDPAEHTVEEVAAYLARDDLDDTERQRVLDAELAGQARKGILGDEH